MGIFSRSLRALIVIGLAGGIAFLLVVMKAEPEKEERKKGVPVVEVITVNPKSKVMEIQAFGTVKARTSVTVSPEVGGRIVFIDPAFVQGGFMEKGGVILKIDERSYRLARDAARVTVAQARADMERLEQEIVNLSADVVLGRKNLTLSRKEYNRIKSLSKQDYASRANLDKAEMAMLQAEMNLQKIENSLALTDSVMKQKKAALEMARVDLARAELSLEKTVIRSGFDLYVMEKSVEKGEFVSPGQILGKVYEKSKLDVDVRVQLEKMKWIDPIFSKGEMPKASVRIAGPADSLSGIWKARVVRLKAHVDEKTRTLPMTLEIDCNYENSLEIRALRPGTFVECHIQGEQYNDIFVVPRFLMKRNDKVFTVENGTLVEKEVEVVRKFKESVYISQGLEKGDKILNTPLPGAVDGMKVRIRESG